MNIRAKLDNVIFHTLLAGFLVAATVLGGRFALSVDVTRDARNSLSPHSLAVLERVDQPATVAVYAGRGSALIQAGRDLTERYTRSNPLVQFKHIDIDRDPSLSRDLDISGHGAVVIHMDERQQRSQSLTENAVTGALDTLANGQTRHAVFVTGHGERTASGSANHHLGEFSARLVERGYTLTEAHLLLDPPQHRPGQLLVIASSQQAFAEAELAALLTYVDDGGQVLWLTDGEATTAEAIAQLTGLTQLSGVIVDDASNQLGLPRPDFAVVSEYTRHAFTAGIDGISLFPRAVAFSSAALKPGWQATPWLSSTARSWNESGEISGQIAPDAANEHAGPLPFAWTLDRHGQPGGITVIGDGDFLANSWLGNGVNLALGERLFDSLSHAGSTAPLPTTVAPDRTVTVSRTQGLVLGSALFGMLPLLLGTATLLSWRRQAH